eukprot:6069174-Prymnesium_polylepis.1
MGAPGRLGHVVLHLGVLAHHLGDDAVVELLRHRVHVAVQLVRRDRLRVDRAVERAAAAHVERRLRLRERLPHLRLRRARRTQDEHTVAHAQQLGERDGLRDEALVGLQRVARIVEHLVHGGRQRGVGLLRAVDLGEEVVDQAEEDADVGKVELGQVCERRRSRNPPLGP